MQDDSRLWDLSMPRRKGAMDNLIYTRTVRESFIYSASEVSQTDQSWLKTRALIIRNQECFIECDERKHS